MLLHYWALIGGEPHSVEIFSLGEDLLAVVEVEMPLEVAHHLVTVGTLLLQRFPQVNSLHVKSEVTTAVGLVVTLVTPVVQVLLVHGVDVFVQKLLPLELLATNPALESFPSPLVFRTVALQKIFHSKYFIQNISVKIFHSKTDLPGCSGNAS